MTERSTVHGPYDTQAQIDGDLGILHDRARLAGESDMRRAQVHALLAVSAAAGIELGAFDQLILARFGQWEPDSAMVVLGLVERAAHGRDGGAK